MNPNHLETIDYHPYQLTFSSKHLGSVANTQSREGLLLRIQFTDIKSYGYSCLHPWPELGDAGINEQLQNIISYSFSNSPLTPLVQQALSCAYTDALARSKKYSLYISENLANHALCELTHPNIVTIIEQKKQLGFRIIKIKVGNNWQNERGIWQRLTQQFPEFTWRLDFNERLTWYEFSDTLNWIQKSGLQEAIDFLEDPVCIHSNLHQLSSYQGSIKIAIDRKIELLPQLDSQYFVGVIKPAIDEPTLIEELLQSEHQLCFTSYLDHPIEQAWAAYQASQWQKLYPSQILASGTLSHCVYQSNIFSELLSNTPYWKKLQGTGLGFDHLLTQLSWTSIKV